MELLPSDFELIRSYIHKICGIYLTAEKEYLVKQRLEPIVTAQGCTSFSEFARILSACQDEYLRDKIIAAITTNETSFFRDIHPYRVFEKHILPALYEKVIERKARPVERRGPKISILSAGSSTGQEPYSLAMLIYDNLQFAGKNNVTPDDFSIVATDVSSRALAKAVAGEYNDIEIARGLTDLQKAVHFHNEQGLWIIKDYLKKMVDFRKVNFIESIEHLGGFDIIFCRNVMIYFDNDMKTNMLQQFYHLLTDDGYLVLGSTENIYGQSDFFESKHVDNSILYVKK